MNTRSRTPPKNRRVKPGKSVRVSPSTAVNNKQVSRYDRAGSSSEIIRTGFRSMLSATATTTSDSLAILIVSRSVTGSVGSITVAGATTVNFGFTATGASGTSSDSGYSNSGASAVA